MSILKVIQYSTNLKRTGSRCGFTIQIPSQTLKIKHRMNTTKQLEIIYYLNFLLDIG